MPDDNLDWYLLTVGSRQEKKVARALKAKGFEVFLPLYRGRRQWSDRVREVELPLFPCHLFVRFRQNQQWEILKTPGVFSIHSQGKHPAPIPEADVTALRRVLESGVAVGRS